MAVYYCTACDMYHDNDYVVGEESMVTGEYICEDAYMDEVSLREALWDMWKPTNVAWATEED